MKDMPKNKSKYYNYFFGNSLFHKDDHFTNTPQKIFF